MDRDQRISRLFGQGPSEDGLAYDAWSRLVQAGGHAEDLHHARCRAFCPLPGRWVDANPAGYVEGEGR